MTRAGRKTRPLLTRWRGRRPDWTSGKDTRSWTAARGKDAPSITTGQRPDAAIPDLAGQRQGCRCRLSLFLEATVSRSYASHCSKFDFYAMVDSCVDCFTVASRSELPATATEIVPAATPRPARRMDCLPGGPFASATGNGQGADRDNRQGGRRPAA
jgi:hypothetical protein